MTMGQKKVPKVHSSIGKTNKYAAKNLSFLEKGYRILNLFDLPAKAGRIAPRRVEPSSPTYSFMFSSFLAQPWESQNQKDVGGAKV